MQHLSLIFEQAFSMRTRLKGLPSVKTVKYKHVKQSRGLTVILHADIVAKIIIVILVPGEGNNSFLLFHV